MNHPRADAPQPLGVQRLEVQKLEVLTGAEALGRIEHALCGQDPAREPAVAEGRALAGLRAASLAVGEAGDAGAGATLSGVGGVELPGASCVHHIDAASARLAPCAFELSAESAQQAVDHALLAHALSARLRRAGVCSLDPRLARSLAAVRLPRTEPARALLDRLAAERGDGDDVVELAAQRAQTVAALTGRPLELVERRGDAGAELVLVATGGEAADASDTAQRLAAAGTRAACVSLALLRPFPATAVATALADARRVFAVGEAARRADLMAELRAAAGEGCEVHAVADARPEAWAAALAERMPGFDAEALESGAANLAASNRIGVAPAGAWGEATARHLAAALAHLAPLRLAPASEERDRATWLAWECDAADGNVALPEGDLLLAADASLLASGASLARLRPGGALVVASAEGSDRELAHALGARARAVLRERELRVHRVAPPGAQDDGDAEPSPAHTSALLAGAALSALGIEEDAARRVALALEAEGLPEVSRWLAAGADGAQALDAAELDPARHLEEVDFRSAPALPLMPSPPSPEGDGADDSERERWAARIHRFHLGGRAPGALPQLPIEPAALGSLSEALRGRLPHPLVLAPCEGDDLPLAARGLPDLLAEAAAAQPACGRTLSDNLARLAELAARLLDEGQPTAALEALVRFAGERLVDDLALPHDEERALSEDLATLRARLPADGLALDLHPATPLHVYARLIHALRAPLRARFDAELAALRERVRDILELDRLASPEGHAADAVAASLGGSAPDHLDAAALARTLPHTPASGALSDERRSRLRAALDTLERHLERADALPGVVFVTEPDFDLPDFDPAPPDGETRAHPDPLAAAVGVFDATSQQLAGLFRAARVARLEVEGRYRPELHDGAWADLTWEGFRADELALLPAVAVAIRGRSVRQRGWASLSELLRSGRPVHVLVIDEIAADDEARDLSRFHVDLGYLSVAHREAYTLGTTLARPERMLSGLAGLVRARGPGVALFSLPSPEPAPLRALRAEAALHGRACLDFRYDPEGGSSWADRFDLSGNPQPDLTWPLHAIRFLEEGGLKKGSPEEKPEGTDGGGERSLELAFTFADAVALDAAYLAHFAVVPPAAWSDEQVPLAEFLERFDPAAPQPMVPFIHVLDDEGTLQRAVLTRELTMACRDRLRGWRVLQELAGHHNVFAERAREAGARESLERLAAALLEGLPAEVADAVVAEPAVEAQAAAPAVVAEPAPEPAAEAAPAEPEPEEEEEELSFDEPWIDSGRCTTCNECTQLNPRMFRYNADKQATLADASAGTFAELVKAAELCPARCIHPGKPRSDDATATPELVERAAAFR